MLEQALGAPKKKKTVAKKKAVKKVAMDTQTKFFNNYSENPHLQQIENGYLKFLEAQHAKESHLKAIKKFQIMHALKKIQVYWKAKFIQIKGRSAIIIQRHVKIFIKKMNKYR